MAGPWPWAVRNCLRQLSRRQGRAGCAGTERWSPGAGLVGKELLDLTAVRHASRAGGNSGRRRVPSTEVEPRQSWGGFPEETCSVQASGDPSPHQKKGELWLGWVSGPPGQQGERKDERAGRKAPGKLSAASQMGTLTPPCHEG